MQERNSIKDLLLILFLSYTFSMSDSTSIIKPLFQIQQEINAPKGKYNSFGKYMYRSCEDILEAVKPILKKHGCIILLSDELVEANGNTYIKSTARIACSDTGDSIENVAFAKEPDSKKGMDASQITGCTSSYARKYALCGLLAIDDNKDPDSIEESVNNANLESNEQPQQHQENPQTETNSWTTWREYPIPFGKNQGVLLGSLNENQLDWYCKNVGGDQPEFHKWVTEAYKEVFANKKSPEQSTSVTAPQQPQTGVSNEEDDDDVPF
jgi:hypothetical protein